MKRNPLLYVGLLATGMCAGIVIGHIYAPPMPSAGANNTVSPPVNTNAARAIQTARAPEGTRDSIIGKMLSLEEIPAALQGLLRKANPYEGMQQFVQSVEPSMVPQALPLLGQTRNNQIRTQL